MKKASEESPLLSTRRGLLQGAAALATAQLLGPSGELLNAEHAKVETVHDRLWLWAHYEGSHNGAFGISGSSRITPVEAAAYMALQNVIMVSYFRKPAPPYDQYALPFESLKQVVWSLVAAGGGTDTAERERVLELATRRDNFVGVIMDDFFTRSQEGIVEGALSVQQLQNLQSRLHSQTKKLSLWVTLYTGQLNRDYGEHMKFIDVMSLWTWRARDIKDLATNLARSEELFPQTRKVLGCYMWDYGQGTDMPIASMEKQCEQGLRWLKQGRIEGMAFLASCICDLNLETVEWTRSWIKQVGSQKLV